MENSIKSNAINHGLYLGGTLALITIAIWFIDLNLMGSMMLGISLILLRIVFGVVSTSKAKSIQGGLISFKEAFTSYFITIVIGFAIASIVSVLLFNYIDPEAAKQIQQITIDATVKTMEGFGAPLESIAETVEQMENQNQFSIGNVLKGLAFVYVFQAIYGLIVALIMKKTDPDA